ncbi:SGNH/GDSL hydrolase family protein [Candidatus Saccharibacteria bacterium]|nr:SGNH/GDSL hydrolase family protein [Candidatus Saccharibacteria bacterium]
MKHKMGGLIMAVVTLGVAALLGTTSVSAAKPLYVALGDSYSSGVGADVDPTKSQPIANSFDPNSGQCQRAYKAYPVLLAANLGAQLRNVSCAGATTANILTTGQFGQPAQINAVTSDAQLVTFTIGGNDIEFSGIMNCIASKECDGNSPEAITTLDILNNQLYGRVSNVITAIQQKAPGARILVGGYPQIYPNEGSSAGTCSSYLSGGEMSGWNYIQNTMNDTIKWAVLNNGGNVRYVDPYASTSPFMKKSFIGQTKDACSTWNQRAMNGYGTLNPSSALHPNLLGQQHYYDIFRSRVY